MASANVQFRGLEIDDKRTYDRPKPADQGKVTEEPISLFGGRHSRIKRENNYLIPLGV